MSSIIFNKLPNSENMTLGERLRLFAEDKYGKKGAINKLAESLGIKPPSLYVYLKDESKPGTELLLKLNEIGCDLSWLLTGKYATNPKEMFDATFKYKQKENPYEKRIKELEEENKKLKEKIKVYEKTVSYLNKIREKK